MRLFDFFPSTLGSSLTNKWPACRECSCAKKIFFARYLIISVYLWELECGVSFGVNSLCNQPITTSLRSCASVIRNITSRPGSCIYGAHFSLSNVMLYSLVTSPFLNDVTIHHLINSYVINTWNSKNKQIAQFTLFSWWTIRGSFFSACLKNLSISCSWLLPWVNRYYQVSRCP